MKKLLLLAICTVSISAYALPTYEPFTEFAAAIAATGTNAINLTTPGAVWTAPGGEQWGALCFSGTAGTHLAGLDIDVTNNASTTIFNYSTLSSILPSGFPGLPSAGNAINIMVVNAEQPFAYPSVNYVGNSAVLHFADDILRPTSGTKTIYVSYLFNLAQAGQLGAGNNGRYFGFLASTNLNEGFTNNPPGPVTGAAYTNWAALFNTYNGNTAGGVHYPSHGLLNKAGGYYIGACDSAVGSPGAGLNWSSTPLTGTYGTPIFVVGAYVLNSGTSKDTNIVWVNPSTTSFGGSTPPSSPVHVWTMGFNMSDLAGLVFIDRVGSGALGGVGTNYIANLIVGSTWSYVTGGPEFTNQPLASTTIVLGGSGSITGAGAHAAGATAAGQIVNYQWVKITNGGATTNNVNPGSGGAGGSAVVSGQNTATLTLTGISAGDAGSYQLVATASGTLYTLNSATAAVVLPDPLITASPLSVTTNYGQTATFTATATTGNAPLHYGWYHDGTALQNGTLPDGSQTVAVNATGTTSGSSPFTITLTLNNVDYLAAGSYYLVVTNNISLQASSTPATLAVNDPVITAQPANPAVAGGGAASFTVAAAGSPTLSYQWYEGTPPGGTQLIDGSITASGATIGITSGSGSSTLSISPVGDLDNGSYYCAIAGSASLQTTNSAAATLTVQDALTIVSPPMSLAERAGDHVAFAVGVTGGGPQFQWKFNGNPITGATGSALVLTNIQTGSNGTYSVTVQNLATAPQTFNATLTVINSTILPLSPTNLVVARVGDGAQALSGVTGNTLYLDQYANNGTSVAYVNSIQVPDEAIGSAYPTGGATSLAGSPALLVQGAGSDAANEAMLTLSGVNQEYIGFAGYCQQYPYTGGSDVTVANLSTGWRGLATINAFGVYSLAYTNYGLYSGGNHTICSMVTLDGTNFWTTGQAGAGTVKYVNSTVATYLNGQGIPSSTGVSAGGGRTIQVVNGPLYGFSSVNNLVVSDAGLGGLYAASGTPQPLASGSVTLTPLLYTGGLPADFAFSPDNQTIYVAESAEWTGTGPGTGGIERWDSNGSGYNYSYTLPALPGGVATNGAQGLTVDFSASATWGAGVAGAKIYATTYGAAGNSLVEIVDTGAASTPIVLATAGPNQALRGVRFGPAAIAPAVATGPQTQTVPVGNSATFSVAATGSAPLFYQWYYGATPIAGATQSSFTTNNISYASAGSYSVVVSNLTTQTATSSAGVLTVTAGAPTITPTPLPSYTETAGDHLAWVPAITGTQPITNYWYQGSTLVQSNVTPGANGSLVLANIQPTNSGTYTLVVSNLYGHASAFALLTVTTSPQTLSSNNLVVVRVGDGVQTLSAATGNTLYLDQYTAVGGYVSTIQIPDEGTGQPYGTGGSSSDSMPFGSPALLVAGAGPDAAYEALLTRSPNGQTLNLAGYCQAYPFSGLDVSVIAGGGGNWHGIGGVDAYGYYTLAFTNTGLYSAGNHQIHAAVDIDGNGTNFYSTGQAGSGYGIKYLNVNFQPANGVGIASVAGSFPGTRVCEVINGNLVFSDVGASPIGIYACSGLPVNIASAGLMIAETNSPVDFAASPDLNTVYIADNGTFTGIGNPVGGIQRWDGVGGTSYTYSYTLGTGTGSTAGARGLAVDFSAAGTWGAGVTGAKLYATTAEASGNRLIKIVDNGAPSGATLMATAGASQALAGVRFGPVIVSPAFSGALQSESALAGSAVTFTSGALGSGPLTYQWYFQAGVVGAFNAILSATNATYTISAAGIGNVGNYYVVIKNPGLLTATSPTVSFTLLRPPQFTSSVYLGPGNGLQLNFTGPAGQGYSIWMSPDVTLSPIQSTWTLLTTGTFSGGTDTYTDPSGGTNPQQFYIISMP
jgi:hypothetical protein